MAKMILLLLLSRQYPPPSQLVDVPRPGVVLVGTQVNDPRQGNGVAGSNGEGRIAPTKK